MKIALDVDATLTDINGFLVKHAIKFFAKRNIPVLNSEATTAEKMFGLSTQEVRPFWKKNYVRYCIRVQLKPGIREVLSALRGEGHELHVVTARVGSHRKDLLGALIRYAVRRKFKRYGVVIDSYTFTNDNIPYDKFRVCKERKFDTIVEDNPNHIVQIAEELHLPVIVMATPENAHLTCENLIRIKDLSELEEAVKQVEKYKG